jgi:hypothetical protein
MLPTLKELSCSGRHKIILISLEKWTMSSVLENINPLDFDVIVLPRKHDTGIHYRNIPNLFTEIIDSLELMKTALLQFITTETIFINHSIPSKISFGLNSIIESFFLNIRARIYVQKHLLSDYGFWKQNESLFYLFLRIIYNVLRSLSTPRNSFLFFKSFMIYLNFNFLKKFKNFICIYNEQEYHNMIKHFQKSQVFLIKNSYIEGICSSYFISTEVKNIVFLTTGSFKYEHSKTNLHQLKYIWELIEFCSQNLLEFYVKVKEGELTNFQQYFESLDTLAVRVISGGGFSLSNIPPNSVVIAPIESSTLFESMIFKFPTFFYENSGDFKKVVFKSDLPWDEMSIKHLKSLLTEKEFKVDTQNLEFLQKKSIELLASNSSLTLARFIYNL